MGKILQFSNKPFKAKREFVILCASLENVTSYQPTNITLYLTLCIWRNSGFVLSIFKTLCFKKEFYNVTGKRKQKKNLEYLSTNHVELILFANRF